VKNEKKERRNNTAKPFLKWAGGKTQLLSQFEKFYPKELREGKIKKYIEPFLGSGAVFFDIVQKYQIESAYLYDINEELIIAYRVIRKDPHALIEFLDRYSNQYKGMTEGEKKKLFYEVRDNFNQQRFQINYNKYSENWIPRTAQLIFLNKTCYNGLFRLNREGKFNVPFGKYKSPRILDDENIMRVSKILQIAQVSSGTFQNCERNVDEYSFVYFDPPYRPISRTSSFTSYAKFNFGDDRQKELAALFNKLNVKYHPRLMLSNSDPVNGDPNDKFFENLYEGFFIRKVSANRMINSDPTNRGFINELLITNYN
jgi:DNA adenine methylase